MIKKICMLALMVFTAHAMEDERIVAARARWIGNEVGFAIFRSIMNAHQESTATLFDKRENKPLAHLDDTWHVFKTYFDYNNTSDELILEHDKFINFLDDTELLHKARYYQRLQRNLSIKFTIL